MSGPMTVIDEEHLVSEGKYSHEPSVSSQSNSSWINPYSRTIAALDSFISELQNSFSMPSNIVSLSSIAVDDFSDSSMIPSIEDTLSSPHRSHQSKSIQLSQLPTNVQWLAKQQHVKNPLLLVFKPVHTVHVGIINTQESQNVNPVFQDDAGAMNDYAMMYFYNTGLHLPKKSAAKSSSISPQLEFNSQIDLDLSIEYKLKSIQTYFKHFPPSPSSMLIGTDSTQSETQIHQFLSRFDINVPLQSQQRVIYQAILQSSPSLIGQLQTLSNNLLMKIGTIIIPSASNNTLYTPITRILYSNLIQNQAAFSKLLQSPPTVLRSEPPCSTVRKHKGIQIYNTHHPLSTSLESPQQSHVLVPILPLTRPVDLLNFYQHSKSSLNTDMESLGESPFYPTVVQSDGKYIGYLDNLFVICHYLLNIPLPSSSDYQYLINDTVQKSIWTYNSVQPESSTLIQQLNPAQSLFSDLELHELAISRLMSYPGSTPISPSLNRAVNWFAAISPSTSVVPTTFSDLLATLSPPQLTNNTSQTTNNDDQGLHLYSQHPLQFHEFTHSGSKLSIEDAIADIHTIGQNVYLFDQQPNEKIPNLPHFSALISDPCLFSSPHAFQSSPNTNLSSTLSSTPHPYHSSRCLFYYWSLFLTYLILDHKTGLHHLHLLLENLVIRLLLSNPYSKTSQLHDVIASRSTYSPLALQNNMSFKQSNQPPQSTMTQSSLSNIHQIVPSTSTSFIQFLEHTFQYYPTFIPLHFSPSHTSITSSDTPFNLTSSISALVNISKQQNGASSFQSIEALSQTLALPHSKILMLLQKFKCSDNINSGQ